MSDLPPPGSGTPPPPPDGPGDEPGDPTEGPGGEGPDAGGDEAAAETTPVAGTEAIDGVDDASTFEDPFPTTVMAAGAVGGAAAVDPYEEVPGSYPTGTPLDDEEALPWYKQRGPLIAAITAGVVALLVAIGLGIWLFGGDDEGPNIRNRVIISLVDENGDRVQRELVGRVNADEFPDSFVWLRPQNALAPDDAVAPPSEDNVEFMWAPTEDVTNQATWLSKFVLRETIPKGWRPPTGPVQCILERDGSGDSTVEMTVAVKPRNVNRRSEITYRFPDHAFRPGDTVRCTLVSTRPVPGANTTTTTSTTTTVPETTTTSTTSTTTTTVPATTTTTSTTTTVPPTTTTSTTTTTTTTSTTTTVAPPPDETAWELVQARPELSEFVTLATDCGWDTELNDPADTLTLFAPDNDALDIAGSGCPGGAEAIFLQHVHDNAGLLEADLAGLVGQQLEMRSGTFADITNGPTIGGAGIVTADIEGSNGVTHVVDALIQTTP